MAEWEITDADLRFFSDRAVAVLKTSAKLGEGVDEAFTALTTSMLELRNAI